ncbi:hypothetical protein M9Y10_009916 [Tritrichomonas musculus]|uniref:Peptidase M60 domain-containing protein n=1 Tax=Tritrichomonas musculus TaxID=1915356 RepID=A0ABR2IPX2_9EUKA
MGCVLSNPAQTSAACRVNQAIDFSDEEPQEPVPPPTIDLIDQLRMDCTSILQGLSQIMAPEQINPIICLQECAYPLFLSSFEFEECNQSIELPIIAFSRVFNGRFIFIGSINFLSHSLLVHTETSAFMENIITWGADYKSQSIKITVLGFPSSIISTLPSDFSSYGYIVEVPKKIPNAFMTTLVFVSSQYYCDSFEEKIIDYVKRGGTVVCFADNLSPSENENQINTLLEDSGLAFSKHQMNVSNTVIFSSDISTLDDYAFKQTLQNYFDILHQSDKEEDVDVTKLDDSTSILRYYINEMTDLNFDDAYKIGQESIDFLDKIGYLVEGNKICPSIVHGLVTVVMSEIIPKLSPPQIGPAPHVDQFPGKIDNKAQVFNIKVRIGLKIDTLNSTGLYVPPGCLAKVITDQPVTLQIGSHSLCLLIKSGPWKRWPTVVSRFYIEPGEPVEFSSPFGGILYFISEKNWSVRATFYNVLRCPYLVSQNKDMEIEPKSFYVPWGEIQTKTLIFTLPSESIKQIYNPAEFCDLYDKLVSDTFSFIGIKQQNPRRIIFDVDLPAENTPVLIESSIIMHVDNVEGVLNINHPNSDILLLLTYLSFSYIETIFLEKEIEIMLSMLAGCYAIKKSWPEEPPLIAVPDTPSKLFCHLFDLCEDKGAEPFSLAIQATSMKKDLRNSREAWLFFINKLSKICKSDLHILMDRFNQTEKILAQSSNKLIMYQIDDGED